MDSESSGTTVTTDGTFIYVLGEVPGVGGMRDLLLIKWDMQGNPVWNKTWGGTGADIPSGICVDGDAIFTCGSTESFGAIAEDLSVIKWDMQGSILWNHTWGGVGDDSGKSIRVEGDAVYVCGYTASYGAGNKDLVLLKWNTSGNLVWNKTWGGTGTDVGFGMWKIGDSVYTCGGTASYGVGGDVVLVKWDVSEPANPPDNQVDGASSWLVISSFIFVVAVISKRTAKHRHSS